MMRDKALQEARYVAHRHQVRTILYRIGPHWLYDTLDPSETLIQAEIRLNHTRYQRVKNVELVSETTSLGFKLPCPLCGSSS
jgi:hypothetical protein